jgi:hypothetical protein
MSKYWILSFLTSAAVIFGCLALITFTVKNRLDFETYQVKFEKLNGVFEQSYRPRHNNLNIIVLHLKNPGLVNRDTYKFSILNSGGSIIVSQAFTGFNVGDPTDLRLQFDPITDSGNKNLILKLDSLSSNYDPILVGVDENNNIAFSSYYREGSKGKEFVNVITNLIIRIGKDQLFFGLLFIFLFVIFWKWRKIR